MSAPSTTSFIAFTAFRRQAKLTLPVVLAQAIYTKMTSCSSWISIGASPILKRRNTAV